MRKFMFCVLLCLSLVLATNAFAETVQPHVDLTDLDAVDAVDALYDLAEEPEINQGKIVRLTGYFTYSNWDGEEIFLLISGGASQIEFVPAKAQENPEQLTLSDEPIIIQGILDSYDNDGYDDVRLIEAQIERAAF